jgi:hypothetical protein
VASNPSLNCKEMAMNLRWFPLALALVPSAYLLAGGEGTKAKFGWTNVPAKMKFPDAKVSGKVMGKAFEPTFIAYSSFVRHLIIAKGSGSTFPEVEIRVSLPIQQNDKLDGQTFVLDPKKTGPGKALPSLTYSPDGKKLPKMVIMPLTEVAMRLEFGKETDGKVPGKIYLCLSDKDKSYLAGTFEVPAGK